MLERFHCWRKGHTYNRTYASYDHINDIVFQRGICTRCGDTATNRLGDKTNGTWVYKASERECTLIRFDEWEYFFRLRLEQYPVSGMVAFFKRVSTEEFEAIPIIFRQCDKDRVKTILKRADYLSRCREECGNDFGGWYFGYEAMEANK